MRPRVPPGNPGDGPPLPCPSGRGRQTEEPREFMQVGALATGMTLRERFAVEAMKAVVIGAPNYPVDMVADRAWEIAGAMMDRRPAPMGEQPGGPIIEGE